MFVEAVRGLRTSLYFAMMEAENRIVMISGPTQDCGKTLVATNLAAVAGQSGQRVLFIDADMRQAMFIIFLAREPLRIVLPARREMRLYRGHSAC